MTPDQQRIEEIEQRLALVLHTSLTTHDGRLGRDGKVFAHHAPADIAYLLTQLKEVQAMNKRWKAAVEGLTPNGSEYVDDPEACAAAIRRRTRYPKMVIELCAQQTKLVEALRQSECPICHYEYGELDEDGDQTCDDCKAARTLLQSIEGEGDVYTNS